MVALTAYSIKKRVTVLTELLIFSKQAKVVDG